MVTAASTAQLAILLVDARHGVVTQTRRHATIAHLLGIPHLVVAVNKMDLAGWREEAFAAIVADFEAFARRTGIDDVRFVPMSALEGDMVVDRGDAPAWYDGPTLLQILETAEVPHARSPARRSAFRCSTSRRPTATLPRGYMGRIESGAIAVGDRVTALPSGVTTTRPRNPHVRRRASRAPGLHASVTLVLADELDISRGDMLVQPSTRRRRSRGGSTRRVCWLGDAPLDPRRTYLLRHTTREVRARIVRIDHLWNTTTQTKVAAPARFARNESAISR